MANEKKDYQTVAGAFIEHASLTSITNKLNKVFVATKNTELKELLRNTMPDINLTLLNV